MWNAPVIQRTVVALLMGAMLSVADRGAAATTPGQSDGHALLDVPYVAQTPELCGGAAVAMVLRYWGTRDVFPGDFASLVGAGDGGILTDTLAAAVRDRGWQTFIVPAADEAARSGIRAQIDRGRPLIALIEVGARTYHYVVIVGSTDQVVVLHDPARAPFRVMAWADFDRVWAASGRWMMLVLPPGRARPDEAVARVTPVSLDVAVRPDQTPCGALVAHSVQLALAGDRTGAEEGLSAATGLCPNDPASWRELAGLRFSQARWSESRDMALAAVRLAPRDEYAWQLVATSRYLMGDVMGALDAWNHMGEPRLDTIVIHGAQRTRHPVVVRAAGLQPRQVLTSEVFGRVQRRLGDLPVASRARMKYEPLDGGLARADLFIDEHQMLPIGWTALGTLGARAALLHELRVDVAGSMGAGELARGAWRWSANRPRVMLGLALPSSAVFPGIISVDGLWDRQTYDATPSSGTTTLVRGERRRVGLNLADWSTRWLRWEVGAAYDRLSEYRDLDEMPSDTRNYLALDSAVHVRLADDRLALEASAGWWAPFGGGSRFGTGGLLAAWRSTNDTTAPVWSAVTEVAMASRVAPLALWQGAGTGHGRSWLLRAHPLLHKGVLTGLAFGRDAGHGSIEYVRPVRPMLAVAGFVDAARAWSRQNGLGTSPLYVDAGVGVRVQAPGSSGTIRIDVAHGLRGGGTTFSASWGLGWPR
jgi:hypothetical protein